jgi:glycosyltransferase involved in cell wall biosynthesis
MATAKIASKRRPTLRGPLGAPLSEFVTVVLPCLDEEDSVGLVVREALEALAAASIPGEVLVVDNGSVDRSAEVALAAGARVIHEPRKGYGRALRSGIAQANGSIVVMADADWTYDMTKLPLLVAPVLQGEADITIGSRLHEATSETMPMLHRYVGTPALTALVRGAGGHPRLPDSQSGFRCFRKQAVSALGLHSDGMEFASEMLIKGSRKSLRILDIPTGYRKRIGTSKLNTFSDGWRHLRLILLLAPELVLLAPGAFLFVVGLVLSTAAFLPSKGIVIGSLRWQPTFFASISLVIGLQAVLVGIVFAWRRAAAGGTPLGHGLGFVRTRIFPRVCSLTGLALLLAGLALDGQLFAQWLQGSSSLTDLPVASLAQSLLLVGGTLASFGLVVMWLRWDEHQNRSED